MSAYANGQIPASALVSIGNGARLVASAASRWFVIVAEVEDRSGWTPRPTGPLDAYRPLSGSYYAQTETFLRRYTTQYLPGRPSKQWAGRTYWLRAGQASAAVPGTSNHGWGSAVDVADIGGFGGTRYDQFAQVATAHGLTNTEGRSVGEAWHWVDQATVHAIRNGTTLPTAPVVTAPAVTTPAPITLMEDDVARIIQHPNGALALVGPGPRMIRLRTMTEVQAVQATGQAEGALIALPNPLIWDTCKGVAERAGTYTD